MERNLILVVDYGTSNIRVNAIDAHDGEIIYSASRKYLIHDRGKGYAEISVKELWTFSEACVEQVLDCMQEKDIVKAITFSFFGDNLIPVDNKGNALNDCILCTDSRGAEEADYINHRLTYERLMDILGDTYIAYKFGAKLLWMRNHAEKYGNAIAYYDSQQQYIFRKLGLRPVNDSTMAARKQLCDIRTGKWSKEILQILDIREEALGEIVPTDEIVGYIEKYGEVKFPEAIPVIAGGHDCDVAMIGMGLIRGTETFVGDIAGTFDHVGYISDGVLNVGKTYPKLPLQSYHGPIKNTGVCLGAFPTAGATLEWFMREINEGATSEDYKKYWEKVCFYGNNTVRVYPTLDRYRGKIEGIGVTTSKENLFQGVIEALTFENRRLIEICEICKKKEISSVRIGGGGAQSNEWMQLRADVSGRKIERMKNIQISSVGSAVLAAVRIGLYNSLEEAVSHMVKVADSFEPDSERNRKYEEQYKEYLQKMNYERSVRL